MFKGILAELGQQAMETEGLARGAIDEISEIERDINDLKRLIRRGVLTETTVTVDSQVLDELTENPNERCAFQDKLEELRQCLTKAMAPGNTEDASCLHKAYTVCPAAEACCEMLPPTTVVRAL